MAGGYDIGVSGSSSNSLSTGLNSPFILTTGGAKSASSSLTPVLLLGGFLLAGIALVWFLFRR